MQKSRDPFENGVREGDAIASAIFVYLIPKVPMPNGKASVRSSYVPKWISYHA